jgi:putative ABC transport system substrate-binding protein
MKTTRLCLSVVLLLAVAYMPAKAQQPTKLPRVGYIGGGDLRSPIFESFQQGLRDLGYVNGRSIVIERRPYYGEAQLNNSAAELVSLNVDAIVAQGGQPARAVMRATKTIPVVMFVARDPQAIDFLANSERPGGNVAGVSGFTTELGGKLLELIKETIPTAKRVAVFFNRLAEQRFPIWKSVDSAAHSLGVDLRWLEAGDGSFGWLYRNIRTAAWRQADAFIILPGTGGFRNTKDIADFGLRNRIPGISWRGDFTEAGGLMSYEPNGAEQSRRAAYLIDKIVKGAKPSDLPVERTTQYELVINLNTAKEIGVTIHPEILMWANRIIK